MEKMKSGKVRGKIVKGGRLIFTIAGIALLVSLIMPAIVLADIEERPHLVRTFVDEEGREIDEIIVPGLPPKDRISEAIASDIEIRQADAVLSDVPAFDWCYGCSATSAAMMFGHYDRTGYSNMYAGLTNGGVCPLNNSVWGSGECPLSATHQGYDGLTAKGHVDDYWDSFNSAIDPYHDNWAEHGYADCTADYMGTNQHHNWENTDGGTTFYFRPDGSPLYDYSGCEPNGKRDGCHGIRLFAESRGYNVFHDGSNYQNYNQYIHEYVAGGFTFDDFKAETDAGRTVIIQIDGHSMLGYGYDDPDTIHIHDTWDHSSHSMTWGGSYSGMQHYAVTVIQLQSLPEITSCDVSGNEMNQFIPNQSVYVRGSGLDADTQYKIWIQDDAVEEGDALVSAENPSATTPKDITTDGSGNLAPTLIWHIPSDAPITHHSYDIVFDNQKAGTVCTYNSTSDGMDSATVAGFVAPVTELPTLILFPIGLLMLVGYMMRNNRKI